MGIGGHDPDLFVYSFMTSVLALFFIIFQVLWFGLGAGWFGEEGEVELAFEGF
jgi:hypothetical protein